MPNLKHVPNPIYREEYSMSYLSNTHDAFEKWLTKGFSFVVVIVIYYPDKPYKQEK